MTESTPDPQVVLERAEKLGGQMTDLTEQFTGLKDRLRTYKRVLWVLGITLAFSIAAVVVAIVVAVNSSHTASTASHALSRAKLNTQAQISSCLSGNKARDVSKSSWLYLYDTLLAQPKSPTQSQQEYDTARKLVEGLRAKVVKAYAHRNCSPSALPSMPPSPH